MMDPKKQRTIWYVVGGILVAAFVVFGATSFKANLTPYVGFEKAMSTDGKVQVAGGLVEGSSAYVDEDEELSFTIYDDDGVELPVRYKGVKPANFEEATQIVAIGVWRDDAFHAEQLLVKCPSKYQGVEDELKTYGQET